MKKVFIKGTVLTVLGLFLLGGCGSDQRNQESQTETLEIGIVETRPLESSIMENQSSENASLEAERVETEGSGTIENEAEGSVPMIVITNEKKEWYSDDGEQLLLTTDSDRVEIKGDDFAALNAAVSARWCGLQDNYDELLEQAQEHYDLMKEKNFDFTDYYVSEIVRAYRIDNQVISFCSSYEGYTGGAHGFYGYESATFDVKSGRELQIEDILSDAEGFYDKAVSYIIERLDENYADGLFPDYRETVETDTFSGTSVCWYLDNTGIVIEYGLYTVAPYVTGAPEVTLPYDEFAEYIKDDYLKP